MNSDPGLSRECQSRAAQSSYGQRLQVLQHRCNRLNTDWFGTGKGRTPRPVTPTWPVAPPSNPDLPHPPSLRSSRGTSARSSAAQLLHSPLFPLGLCRLPERSEAAPQRPGPPQIPGCLCPPPRPAWPPPPAQARPRGLPAAPRALPPASAAPRRRAAPPPAAPRCRAAPPAAGSTAASSRRCTAWPRRHRPPPGTPTPKIPCTRPRSLSGSAPGPAASAGRASPAGPPASPSGSAPRPARYRPAHTPPRHFRPAALSATPLQSQRPRQLVPRPAYRAYPAHQRGAASGWDNGWERSGRALPGRVVSSVSLLPACQWSLPQPSFTGRARSGRWWLPRGTGLAQSARGWLAAEIVVSVNGCARAQPLVARLVRSGSVPLPELRERSPNPRSRQKCLSTEPFREEAGGLPGGTAVKLSHNAGGRHMSQRRSVGTLGHARESS